jgi:hypothetical protein
MLGSVVKDRQSHTAVRGEKMERMEGKEGKKEGRKELARENMEEEGPARVLK